MKAKREKDYMLIKLLYISSCT